MSVASFSAWVDTMMQREPKFKETMVVAKMGQTPDRWLNYHAGTKSSPAADVTGSRELSIADFNLDDMPPAIMAFEDIRRIMNMPQAEGLAIITMTGDDGQNRVYAVADCGEVKPFVLVFTGTPGQKWSQYQLGNRGLSEYTKLEAWIAARPAEKGYVPLVVTDPEALIVHIGSTM